MFHNDAAEAARRFQVWSANVAHIAAENARAAAAGRSTRLGLTAFTDLTREEFRAAYLAPVPATPPPLDAGAAVAGDASDDDGEAPRHAGCARALSLGRREERDNAAVVGKKKPKPVIHDWRYMNTTPAASVDWRTHGVVGVVKDQVIYFVCFCFV
jgi:hypothetical protein